MTPQVKNYISNTIMTGYHLGMMYFIVVDLIILKNVSVATILWDIFMFTAINIIFDFATKQKVFAPKY